MTAAREALQLPILFLTVLLLGAIHVADRVALRPPSLFGLVMGVVLLGLLVRSGALAPERLMHATRSRLANLNGLTVIVSCVMAAAQATSTVARAGRRTFWLHIAPGYAIAALSLVWVLRDFHLHQLLRDLAAMRWNWVARHAR